MEGIFAVHKPKGMTSHDVVAVVRKKTGIKRVGHGGTLDPMAEGILVIAVGRENTKQLDLYVKGDKEYIAEVTLGANSTTDDREGVIENVEIKSKPTKEEIEKVITLFVGEIQQTPPIYSSVKIGGKPAHRRVRAGQQVTLNSRTVKINNITIDHYAYPILKLSIECGSGVYIRSLARDIGYELNTGGYLTALLRTRVNNFLLKDAKLLEDL